ncbi:MAG: Hsp20/alpha crystallin family protein [Chloroflexi bacterium]|nr:Hsp20/alpha crystallin family protein [Chloroflexota bacterium]
MREMHDEIQRLFELTMGRPLGYLLISQGPYTWQPPTDVFETDSEIIVKVELAGMSANDVDIVLGEAMLVITGKRDNQPELRKTAYHQMGISYGQFRAQIPVPFEIDREQVKASYENGFLFVHLPKAACRPLEATRITITVPGERGE